MAFAVDGGVLPHMTTFYHGPLSKRDCHELLLADMGHDKPGKFLLRDRPDYPKQYILSVVYKGKPTHHLIARQSDSRDFTVNNMSCGAGVNTLAAVVASRRVEAPRWPVPLTDGVVGIPLRDRTMESSSDPTTRSAVRHKTLLLK